MNKKFLIVALMAALSTVGYGAWNENLQIENLPLSQSADKDKTMENFNELKEQLQSNKNNLDTLNKFQEVTSGQVGDLTQEVESVKGDVDFVKGEVERVEGEVTDLQNKVETGFENLQNQVSGNSQALGELGQDIVDLNNKKADKTEVEDLKTQVENNTATTTTNSQLIGDLTQEVESVKGDVDFVKGEVERVENDVTDLQNKVETGFDNLQNQVSGNSQALGELGQDIVDLNNNKADKTEVENALANKADKEDVDFVKGEVERVENDVTGLQNKLEDYDEVKENANSAIILGQQNSNKIDDLYANKVDNSKFEEHKVQQAAKDEEQDDRITTNEKDIAQNKQDIADLRNDYTQVNGRLSGLEKKVDNLDNKMNKGLSLMAAMNAVDFQNVQTGEMAIGAGVGHYGNAQSVALGVAYSPVEDLTVNAKYSVTAGDVDSFALGAGATYKFKVGR